MERHYEPIDEQTGESLVLPISRPDPAVPRRQAAPLRRELSARNLARAKNHEHEATWSITPSVLYTPTPEANHGNFHPASYPRILANPAWSARLQKPYTASRRIPHGNSRARGELDCANSSDALLMNIFCHPSTLRARSLQALLSIPPNTKPDFGLRTHLSLRNGHTDRTEIDMRLQSSAGDLLIEAKLTESNFQTARPALMARYKTFETTFDLTLLPTTNGHFRAYQLLRSILVAQHLQARFAVLLDARRLDLIHDVFLTYRAVRHATLRSRLHLLTWQEVAACVPRTLQAFLAVKYGIEPSR